MSSSPKRIVIFGINYAPELTGIAPYTTSMAQHFAKTGHSVRVITGFPHYPEWRRVRVAPANGHLNPRVVRYQHFVPKRANALGRMLYEATWLMSASRAFTGPPADVVIGVVPSLSGGLLSLIAGRRWQTPVGLVIKDLMGPAAAQSGYQGGAAVAGITGKLERSILRRADGVVIISEGFREYLQQSGVPDNRIHRIQDWSHPGKATVPSSVYRQRVGWGQHEFVCLHAGNMGKKQGLDNVLDAAVLMMRHGVRVVLAGNGNDRARLVNRAGRIGADNVTFLDLQPPGLYEAMLRAADVLLLNQRGSVAEMSLPSKLASYFAAGRPIAAAAAKCSPTAIEISEAGAGVVVQPDKPEEMAEAIMALKTNRKLQSDFGRRGELYAERNLAESQSLELYDRFLAGLEDNKENATRA